MGVWLSALIMVIGGFTKVVLLIDLGKLGLMVAVITATIGTLSVLGEGRRSPPG